MSNNSFNNFVNIDNIPSNIAVYEPKDDDFIFVGFNSYAQKTENIKKEELLGKKVTEVFPGVKEFGIFEVFQRVAKTKKSERFELNLYKDDTRSSWRVNDVVANEDGTIMAIYQDVSQEIYLDQKMKSLGYMVDSSENEYYIFDKKSLKFTYLNESAKKNTSFMEEEILNRKFSDLICLDFDRCEELLKPLLSHKVNQIVMELKHQRKDGSQYSVESRIQLLKFDKEEFFLANVIDLTEQKSLEHKLETLGLIVNNSVNEVYLFDEVDLKFTYFNKSASQNIGYELDEIKLMSPVDIKPTFSYEDFIDMLKPLKTGEKNLVVFETEHQRKDGSCYPVEARVQLMGYNEKNFYVAIVLDITKRKENERALQEHQHMLLTQSKLASMGEMIGNIAHQWRQPLSVISTVASGQKISMDYEQSNNNTIYESFTKIVEITQDLSNTIDDFRNFYKPTKTIEKFFLHDVLKKCYSIIYKTFDLKEIKLVEDIEDVEVEGYFNEMTQAIINILNNANDVLESKDHERAIFVNISKNDKYAILSIADNAGGLKDDIIDKVFEPYFTTKHQAQGTGIGLYMVEQIITKHMHGCLSVCNKQVIYNGKNYQGANFTIKIPLKF